MEDSTQPDPGNTWQNHHAAELSQPFLRLNFATLWVRDQERSRRFFVDQLGFQAVVDSDVPGLGRWIIVMPPAGLPGLALVVPLEGSPESQRIGQNTGLSFLTEDVKTVFEEWSKQGVRFALPPMEPSWGSGQARFALFEDV
ncbi:MAG TPA: VOC family protein, partial [Candidatus Sulfopaludibacter sp.]|nr:VOC family protein [Candidatus Sulfopaludibacter sp.]